ncbi:MAG: FAD-binding protein [Syntrophobacterales bacterium]|nr:FAD-binding protein [Syntrophobacterales bacterium]
MVEKDGFLLKCAQIVGHQNLLLDPEDRLAYGFDASRLEAMPACVIMPSSSEEVSLILKEASRERIPIYPRGAGSGMVGGAVPTEGGVVLSTERMNRIIEIDDDNFTVLVEPGVVTGTLQRAVASHGLFYPPDPSSLAFSTIGGNVATGAGGPRAVKYGVTKDYVLGLEVVLASGEIIKTGGSTVKRAVGYDLTRLMVGSEGTLGIITKILLRLIPMPKERYLLFVPFRNEEDAAKAVVGILKSRILPSAIEFMDGAIISLVSSYLRDTREEPKPNIPDETGSILLIELDDPQPLLDRNTDAVRQICIDNGALLVSASYDEKESESLWSVRRAISPSLARIRPAKINEDVVVPRSKLPHLVKAVQAISKRFSLPIVSFGHAGDGNLHVNILYNPEDEGERKAAIKATESLFQAVIELRGSISGEHGIGLAKSPFIRWEISPETLETMWRIKCSLDPYNILNPGKIFVPNRAFIEKK